MKLSFSLDSLNAQSGQVFQEVDRKGNPVRAKIASIAAAALLATSGCDRSSAHSLQVDSKPHATEPAEAAEEKEIEKHDLKMLVTYKPDIEIYSSRDAAFHCKIDLGHCDTLKKLHFVIKDGKVVFVDVISGASATQKATYIEKPYPITLPEINGAIMGAEEFVYPKNAEGKIIEGLGSVNLKIEHEHKD